MALRGAAALDDQYRRWSPPGWIKASEQEYKDQKFRSSPAKPSKAGAPLCRIIPHAHRSVKRRIVCPAFFSQKLLARRLGRMAF
jgi:hypothetical protein